MGEAGRLVIERPAEGVAVLRIERPARRGALSAEILEALRDAFAQTSDGCLVVTGTGEIFSAGYDLSGIGDPIDPQRADATIAPETVPALDALRDCRVPVIAALNGPALGGGLELALGCDVRLAVPGAYLAAPAGKLGLVYAPGGLERILGGLPASLAAELFVLGRRVDAARAHALGVLTAVVTPVTRFSGSPERVQGAHVATWGKCEFHQGPSETVHPADWRACHATSPPLTASSGTTCSTSCVRGTTPPW